tara:strand:+ start:1082 stop:2014 length:933 start_codon:yes stop_codon:yes gene_type:complete
MITGSNGFLGSNLCKFLAKKKYKIKKITRNNVDESRKDLDLENYIDWTYLLEDVDIIIHTAARVHISKKESKRKINLYEKINTKATINLAQQASQNNVKRFIFISTVKVVGEKSHHEMPLNENDVYKSVDPYAKSKIEAEKLLLKLSRETSMDIIIIRPPLVYGPNVGGNFLSLMNLIYKGFPMPFKAAKNCRSLISINNLCEFIDLCIKHPNARNQIFFISDDNDMPVSELIEKISLAMNKSIILLYIPIIILKIAGILVMKKNLIDKLTDPLQISSQKAKNLLNWMPSTSSNDAIKLTVRNYLKSKRI